MVRIAAVARTYLVLYIYIAFQVRVTEERKLARESWPGRAIQSSHATAGCHVSTKILALVASRFREYLRSPNSLECRL
jgi:hypothetical protein